MLEEIRRMNQLIDRLLPLTHYRAHVKSDNRLFLARLRRRRPRGGADLMSQTGLALDMLVKRKKMDNFMKAGICFGLWVALVASFVSVRAEDTSEQALARAALEQKLRDLDNPQPQPAPGTPSGIVVAKPGESATNTANTVAAKAVTPQTAPAASTPVAAPAAVAPLTVAPAATAQSVAAPTNTQPATVPATPRPNPALAGTKSSSPPVKVNPTNAIVTTDGMIYENAQVEKVESDGIIISYTLPNGGWAMSKVYFNELSAELRQRYEKK